MPPEKGYSGMASHLVQGTSPIVLVMKLTKRELDNITTQVALPQGKQPVSFAEVVPAFYFKLIDSWREFQRSHKNPIALGYPYGLTF